MHAHHSKDKQTTLFIYFFCIKKSVKKLRFEKKNYLYRKGGQKKLLSNRAFGTLSGQQFFIRKKSVKKLRAIRKRHYIGKLHNNSSCQIEFLVD